MDYFSSPYPFKVTHQLLKCFDGEYTLQDKQHTNVKLSCLVDLGEELWMYSKNREFLVDKEDRQYLSDNLTEIKRRIDEMIKDMETKVSEDILSDIKAMCLKVYSGDSFDDETYNKLISYVQTAVTS